MTWTPLFSHQDELALTRNNLLTTLPVLPRQWMVDFMFKPTNVTTKALKSILHLTDKEDINNANYGGRVPAVWLTSSGDFQIGCPKKNAGTRYHSLIGPPVGKWTQITIIQEDFSGESIYRVLIDGVEKYNIENPQDEPFNNVRVYASNPWHNGQPGFIKNLSIKANLQKALLQGKFICKILHNDQQQTNDDGAN